MILDFHTHTYPEALAPRVIANSAQLHVRAHTDATAAGLADSMRAADITHAVVLHIATRPGQTATIIESARQALRPAETAGAPRLTPFASVHPFEEDWRGYLQTVKDLGFAGVKLHPDYQGFYIDDARLEPYYRAVAELGLVMVFHAGFDVVSPDNIHASAKRIRNVLPLLEKTPTVLAHMGGYRQERETLELLCGSDVYFDTSFNLDEMDIEDAREIFRRHSPERMLFGTDSPWHGQREMVEYFCGRFAPGFLSPADVHGVLWDNGARLLGLPTDETETAGGA